MSVTDSNGSIADKIMKHFYCLMRELYSIEDKADVQKKPHTRESMIQLAEKQIFHIRLFIGLSLKILRINQHIHFTDCTTKTLPISSAWKVNVVL